MLEIDIVYNDIKRKLNELGVIEAFDEDFPRKDTRKECITEKDIEKYKNNWKPYAIQTNRFENTIKENIEIFDILMRTLMSINPNIKSYIVLIPLHKIVEDLEKVIEDSFKNEFYSILYSFNETMILKY